MRPLLMLCLLAVSSIVYAEEGMQLSGVGFQIEPRLRIDVRAPFYRGDNHLEANVVSSVIGDLLEPSDGFAGKAIVGLGISDRYLRFSLLAGGYMSNELVVLPVIGARFEGQLPGHTHIFSETFATINRDIPLVDSHLDLLKCVGHSCRIAIGVQALVVANLADSGRREAMAGPDFDIRLLDGYSSHGRRKLLMSVSPMIGVCDQIKPCFRLFAQGVLSFDGL